MIMTRLYKTGAAALVAAVGLTTTGCIQSDESTVLEKDGSGTAVVNMSVDLTGREKIGLWSPQRAKGPRERL